MVIWHQWYVLCPLHDGMCPLHDGMCVLYIMVRTVPLHDGIERERMR